MLKIIFLALSGLFINCKSIAQRSCGQSTYLYQQLSLGEVQPSQIDQAENFIKQILLFNNGLSRTTQSETIRIPVVVHILYHFPNEIISDEQVRSQIAALNRDFRRLNADSIKTPACFKPLAADCEIEFVLASSDPKSRFTTGIIRKYSPIEEWEADDKIKFSSETGDDGWDPNSYFNIWVGKLNRLAGYSSVMGGSMKKDGIVIDAGAFGTLDKGGPYNMGKTAVHETGHWLGLKHIWGDTDCGDDLVDDTPKQSFYTVGCPTNIRVTCNNGPNGNMYMNYMDFTDDACMNLFTFGQKARMKALFAPGGLRHGLLASKGLDIPINAEMPVADEPPGWLQPHIYPNPAHDQLQLDLAYDIRWIGNLITLYNASGQKIKNINIQSKIQQIGIRDLPSGVYILFGVRNDGVNIKLKFIK